jgi:hydroxymethylpyrimidine/phosphomethylpyrimidine kinase
MSPSRRSDARIALTIAGSDSGGGAGIQADLKTFAAHGVYGLSAITALTAQSTTEVRAVHPVPPDFVRVQVETLLDDFQVDAVKTGMLGCREMVVIVAELLDRIDAPKVIDPVMVASSGARLIDDDAIDAMVRLLVPRATLVTPNLDEVAVMLGAKPRSKEEMIAAAKALCDLGAKAALVKGGHLPGDDLVDVLFDGEVHLHAGKRIATQSTHGTGCSYASAIAAHLAQGAALVDAVRESHEWLVEAIARAPAIGRGMGPIHHGWR